MPNRFLPNHLFILLFLFPLFQAFGQNSEVRGFLYDAKTGEPVIFSPVFLVGTPLGANTDVNGFFSISKIPEGKYKLMVVSLIYDTIQEDIQLTAGKILSRKFFLKETVRELKAVEIKGSKNRQARIGTVNASITRITPKEIRYIPPVGGEHDLAQYLQTIPGVVFTGDQGGQLYMRGGSNVQTLTLMDGMMVYNPFHSLGLFSVFDTDILKNIDVYTAAFPADYGGRTSSVIDVKTIDGNKNRISGKIGVNPFTAKAILDGPIYKGKEGSGITFLASFRNSYLNKTSPTVYPYANEMGSYLPYSFSDAYGKLTFHGDKGNKASLFGFNFQDRAKISKLADFGWKSSGFGGNFILLPSNTTVLISGNLGYSQYNVDIKEANVSGREAFINNLNGGLDFTYFFNENELKYGLGLVSNSTKFTPDLDYPSREVQEANNSELFAFVKYRYNLKKRLILEPNLRVHYFASLGRILLEPRFGAKFHLTEKIRLKAAAGLYSQNLVSTQSDRDVVALFQGFISSPEGVYGKNMDVIDRNNPSIKSPLQTSRHLVAGIEFEIGKHLEFTIEPYIKTFSEFVNINRNRTFPEQPIYIIEESMAKGIDFLVKYDLDPIYLQVSYSLAKLDRTFDTLSYPPVFDRRHNINMVGVYKFGKDKGWEVSARWNFGTGFPFTQTVAFYENLNLNGNVNQDPNTKNGQLGIYYGSEAEFNRGRQPVYHRLDVSLTKSWKLGENQKLEAVFSLVNSYNRQNLFYFDRVSYQRVNQLPILPALGVSYKF